MPNCAEDAVGRMCLGRGYAGVISGNIAIYLTKVILGGCLLCDGCVVDLQVGRLFGRRRRVRGKGVRAQWRAAGQAFRYESWTVNAL